MIDRERPYWFVTPSLKATGGNLELVRLAASVASAGKPVELVTFWTVDEPIPLNGLRVHALSRSLPSLRNVLKELLPVSVRFCRLFRRSYPAVVVLSHFVTYLAGLFVPRDRLWYFIQATEWEFIPRGPGRSIIRIFILAMVRRGRVLTANTYLTAKLEHAGVGAAGQVSIWADPEFAVPGTSERDIDLVLMLRRGSVKRADLVEELLTTAREHCPDLQIALITPDDEFAERWMGRGLAEIMLRPSRLQMRALYQRSRTYVLLSDYEGFGLPPLEAMGAGVVPLCRDAGGVRAYMVDELAQNLLPTNVTTDEVLRRVQALKRDDAQWQHLSTVARRIFEHGLVTPAGRLRAMQGAGFIEDPACGHASASR